MGDRAGAAALYDEFARRVARDFDVKLSSETRSVIRALRERRDSGGTDRNAVAVSPVPVNRAAPASESPVLPTGRVGKQALLAGIAGALLVMAVAAKVGPGRAAASRASPGGIAVMPFRVSEADSTLTWLGDGIVELLTARLAGAVGTGRVVEGRVTGTSQHLILSASLSSAGDSTMPTRAVAEGPADSLAQMADRLAGQLLGIAAGLDGTQLASLTGAPLPAIRLFLAGQVAYRKGRMETAIQLFAEAIALDSTFALAGLQHMQAVVWAGPGTRWQSERGRRAALAGRDRLSPADRALLDASPAEWKSAPDMFARLNAAVRAFPQRPEAWYSLGDAHFHWGALAGEERWAERAADAFRRGWLLDSAGGASAMGNAPIAPPMQHLVELAHMRHDTAEVVRLASSVLAADSTSDLAREVTWHRAMVTSARAREAFWDEAGGASQRVTMHIVLFMHWSGIGVVDRDRARQEDQGRLRAHDPGYASWAFTVYALNAGRPGDIPPAGPTQGFAANKLHRDRIRQALSWDGDTNVALESVRILGRSAASPASGEAVRQQLFDACAIGEWQASRGDYAAAASAITRLRRARVDQLEPADAGETARYVSLCAALLEAMRASGLRLPDARARVVAADSVARDFIHAICCGERLGDANIQIARLWEREGDLPAALAAVARGATAFLVGPAYLSTLLREEGRLAALTGDTTRAVNAYRRYLAFRPNPQTSLKPGVDSARRELRRLEGNQLRGFPMRRASRSPR
jgi:tetratricopeptide (TPR) repeat protein